MSLELLGHIPLPGRVEDGRLDHAALHRASSQLYLAHTSNDAVDVISCASDKYLHSIPDLREVAGVLVSDERDLIFTSNRAESTVSIIPPAREADRVKVTVGIRPNGLALDPTRNLLLTANVGEPHIPSSHTVSVVDVQKKVLLSNLPVPGRPRWAVYDPHGDAFFVNIMDPPQIVALDAGNPEVDIRCFKIPARGPHGLDLDREGRRLFCACDEGKLVVLDLDSGKASIAGTLSGKPDVVFFNKNLGHLYVAVREPGVLDVFDTDSMDRIGVTPTEAETGTIALDARRNKVYAFLPGTNRAAVFLDREAPGV